MFYKVESHHHHQGVHSKGRSFTANLGIMAAVLPKGRSSTANSGTKVASRCSSFPLLSALQIVGILKITPHSYPCPLFRFSKYGNPSYVCTPENMQRVSLAVQWSLSRSAVQHAAALRISDRTARQILHKVLKFHPCKILVAQQLKPQDRSSRLHFAIEFGAILQENGNVLNNLCQTRHIFT